MPWPLTELWVSVIIIITIIVIVVVVIIIIIIHATVVGPFHITVLHQAAQLVNVYCTKMSQDVKTKRSTELITKA